eukprot:TRINITY_DN14329_c0_g1_i3.p1 TRINITY_DN14329_c0_g1~~TRINITY_DN14329_c0_g1_i3.p1  ORF type:complete len:478 (-),score=45.64 TRINITY_DN14329_c0_g1_i3:173-1606(-)
MGAECSTAGEALLTEPFDGQAEFHLDAEESQLMADEVVDVDHNHLPGACAEPERCAACLQALAVQPLGVCVGCDGRRVCQHFFHLACLRRVRPRRCPHCRTPFHRHAALPDVRKDLAGWAKLVAVGDKQAPSRRDLFGAFKALLLQPPDEVENLVMRSLRFAGGDDELVGEEDLRALLRTVPPYMAQIQPLHSGISDSSTEASDSEENAGSSSSDTFHRGNSEPGSLCSCGRMHVHRGDRVKRGRAWRGGDEDGGDGQLGTIVRDEEGLWAVYVQWEGSGLSSTACSAWLRRQDSEGEGEALLLANAPSEASLRQPARLYYRCRVLPDQALVQRWFSECPPCPCSRRTCRGGVRWNAQACRHLGREGYVLRRDDRDGTVLVEMTGRCNCKLWYPALAVETVYDPDIPEKPRFKPGDAVRCKVNGDWHKGTISHFWWRPSSGWGNRPTAPYYVKLNDGRCVFAPRDSDGLIKALSMTI